MTAKTMKQLSGSTCTVNLMEIYEELNGELQQMLKPTKCYQFKPYNPKGICSSMMPLGYCVNCGKHEDLHNDK